MPYVESYTKQINRSLYGIQTIQEISEKAKLIEPIQALQVWQNQRFLITHQNTHNESSTKNAIEVLVYKVFSWQEFTPKNIDNSELVAKACKLLPKEILRALASGLQLNLISLELDFELAQKIKTTSINQDIYAHAYIESYNTNLRQKQLTCVKQLGIDLANLNLYWGTSSLLTLYRWPANFFGLNTLHEFIQSIFRAFNQVTNTEEFFDTILSKESELMPEYLNLASNKQKCS